MASRTSGSETPGVAQEDSHLQWNWLGSASGHRKTARSARLAARLRTTGLAARLESVARSGRRRSPLRRRPDKARQPRISYVGAVWPSAGSLCLAPHRHTPPSPTRHQMGASGRCLMQLAANSWPQRSMRWAFSCAAEAWRKSGRSPRQYCSSAPTRARRLRGRGAPGPGWRSACATPTR